MSTATHFVVQDWFSTPEGKDVHGSLVDRKTGKRKTFGMIIHNFNFLFMWLLSFKDNNVQKAFTRKLLCCNYSFKIFLSQFICRFAGKTKFPTTAVAWRILVQDIYIRKRRCWQNKYCRQTDGKQNAFKSQWNAGFVQIPMLEVRRYAPYSLQPKIGIFTARGRSSTGRYYFHRRLSVHTGGGGGVPHLHPIILPLVPCPFWGYPPSWDRVPPILGWGTLPDQVRRGGTPVLRWANPPGQVRMGGYPTCDCVLPPTQVRTRGGGELG